MSSLTFASAHQLARMIRDRQVSAVEVLDAYLTQIAKHNSQLNAICTLDEDNARTRARLADEALARGENWGALHGVPITIKDIFETAGLRTARGQALQMEPEPEERAGVLYMGFPSRLKTFLKQPDSAPQQAIFPSKIMCLNRMQLLLRDCGQPVRSSREKPTRRNWLPIIKAQILCFHG